jgi:hypothetical protein
MDEYYTPRQRVLSSDYDHNSSFGTTLEESPMAQSPKTPLHFNQMSYDFIEMGKEYRIVSKASVESDSDADSCITNYDLKQLFQATQNILEREEGILKSSTYESYSSKLESEPSLDSTLLQEENHVLESQNIHNEITTAVDKLAYGHASCKEWKVLTPLSNIKMKNNADASDDVHKNNVENCNRNKIDQRDDRDKNLIYKLLDSLCCDFAKPFSI